MKTQIGCVIMAAGSSTRFGKNDKLLEEFANTTLIERMLEAVPFARLDRCLMVAGSTEVLKIATQYNIQVVINTKPELGIGRTIKLGTAALGAYYDGYMYLVGDQPLLNQNSIIQLIEFWEQNTDCIAALGYGKRIGNPVIFPNKYHDELMALSDSDYGRVVYQRHLDKLKTVQVANEYELMDIDTVDDLNKLINHYKK